MDDLGASVESEEPAGVNLAPPPVKGGFEGNVATGLPGSGGASGMAGAGGGSAGDPNLPATQPEPGLNAYFDFDASLPYAFDLSGNAHHGTPSGTGVNLTATGRSGQGASFVSGAGSILVQPSPKLDFTTAATIEFWIRLQSMTTASILGRGAGFGDNAVTVRTSQGNVQVVFSRAGSGATVLTSDPGVLGASWRHVAIVNDGSSLSLYINGSLETSTTGGYLGAYATGLTIGQRDASDTAFSGVLDELRVWAVARNQGEICFDAGGTWLETEQSCTL